MSGLLPFLADYAITSRSKCRQCLKIIEKDSLRIAEVVPSPFYDDVLTEWYHWSCCLGKNCPKSLADIENIDNIRWKDQEVLRIHLKSAGAPNAPIASEDLNSADNEPVPNATLSADESDGPSEPKKPKQMTLEQQLKEQNEEFFELRDQLKRLSQNDIIELLSNEKDDPRGENAMLDTLCDRILFGIPERCTKCLGGKFKLISGVGYKCQGYLSPWAKCDETIQNPNRVKFLIPSHVKETLPILKDFQPTVSRRILRTMLPPTSGAEERKSKRLISTTSDNQKEDFLDKVENFEDVSLLITKKNIAPWGTDPIGKIVITGSRLKTLFSSEDFFEQKIKIIVKNGAAVDPESNLVNSAHVYWEFGQKYSAVLVECDINANKNRFYKLQVLKDDHRSQFYLFTRWGRIGTDRGGKKCDESSYYDCLCKFKKLYDEKTGNTWDNRGNFVKNEGKVYHIDIEDDPARDDIVDLRSEVLSKLEEPVQELIVLIFGEVDAKRTAKKYEYELDTEQMPLGRLPEAQLDQANKLLEKLQQQLSENQPNKNALTEETNKFYTLVPHSFGDDKPLLLDSEKLITIKRKMLHSLKNMKIDNVHYDKSGDMKNPIDAYYEQLDTDIQVLDVNSREFEIIKKYAKNTHGESHKFEIKIQHIYKVKRREEEQRYEPFGDWKNRKLLWHGSSLTNFASILSVGLKVTPPEVLLVGYMFNRGIYFADMVSKAAQYCGTPQKASVGLLLLCEVALGDMCEKFDADHHLKLPRGKKSTFGRGKTQPDPTKAEELDGVLVPCGSPIAAELPKSSSLDYNEFVVYNEAQVKIRYLVQVGFEYP